MKRSYSRKGSKRYDYAIKGRLAKFQQASVSNDPTPFYRSLLNPLGTRIAGRVPDLACYPSQSVVIDFETTQTGGSAGCSGGYLLLTSNGPGYCIESDPSTNAAIAFISQTRSGSDAWQGGSGSGNTALPGANNLVAYLDAYRIVGAGINVEFIGNDSNNQGQITCAYYTSASHERDNAVVWTDNTKLENAKFNYTGAVKNGCYAAWLPIDTDDLNYGKVAAPTTATTARVDSTGARNFGSIQWHASGLSTTEPPQFRVTIRVHIEAIAASTLYAMRSDEAVVVNPGALSGAFATAVDSNKPGPAVTPAVVAAKNVSLSRLLAPLYKHARKAAVAAGTAAIGSMAYRMAQPYDKYGYA